MNIRGFSVVASCVAAASLALAGHASATVHHLTYSGVVTSALDITNEFGPGATLIGSAFTALVTYDDAKPGATYTGGVYYDDYRGSGVNNPLSVTTMFNGVTRTFGLTEGYDSRVDRTLQPNCLSGCTDADFQQHAEDRYTQGNLSTLNYINLGGFSSDGTISGLAHTAPNFTNPPVDLYAYLTVNEQDIFTLASRHSASMSVRIDSVSGGVPEPGAWALMLMGFGGVGALLRRRRANLVLAAA